MKSFAERLLSWYDRARRDLPWRNTSDPWAIWVSEVMLQQTRVEVVQQIYPRFLKRFPTPDALAKATDDQMLAGWRGLGYYRRVRLLRQASRQVVERYRGRVPDTIDELGELAGVGEYTRGAVASIAFGLPAVAIDGNVERVISRHRGIEENVKLRASQHRIREFVAAEMNRDRAGDFNQALMELGATVCAPRSPNCVDCPVQGGCAAHADGLVEVLPRRPRTTRTVEVQARAVLVRVSKGRVLGSRIPEDQINAGQVDLPGPGVVVPMKTTSILAKTLRAQYGVAFQIGPVVTTVLHAITHHRIRLQVHQAQCAHGPGPNLMAVRPDDTRIPWTTVARKAFQQAALFLAASDRES